MWQKIRLRADAVSRHEALTTAPPGAASGAMNRATSLLAGDKDAVALALTLQSGMLCNTKLG
jgi:hypothetical protein